MRELKFRAWSEEDREYRTDLNVFRLFHGKIICTSPMYNLEGDRFDVEQYTGLKDKNGKEIYEGDIVEQFVCGVHQFKGKECGRKTLWQVRWDEEECCFELHYLSGSLFGDSMMSNSDEYEVTGNIHENPELLEVGEMSEPSLIDLTDDKEFMERVLKKSEKMQEEILREAEKE